ncbi:MAG: AraC family transcriptional regulator [Chitinophagaceae bacterium]
MSNSLKLKEPDRNCLISIYERITKDPLSHFTIESLAYDAGINKKKLTYGFKQLFGMAVYEYQIYLRMVKAEALLLETEKDVQMIAALTGYKTKSSFTVAFKKKHNIAPHQWRKKNSILSMQ